MASELGTRSGESGVRDKDHGLRTTTDAGKNPLGRLGIAQTSPADEQALQAQGVDVALDTVAATIGRQTGVARASFQFA
jgi:hypothetical protein